MNLIIKIARVINIIALCFLILGPYGLVITGFLQVISAIVIWLAFPKSKWIYSYFIAVILFFLVWDKRVESYMFLIPIMLLFYLTYLIHFKFKKVHYENSNS